MSALDSFLSDVENLHPDTFRLAGGDAAQVELDRLETVELGADKLTNAFAKQADELAALNTALFDQKNIIEHFQRLLGVDTSTEAFQQINALREAVESARNGLNLLLLLHRQQAFVTCEETCWCWGVEAAIAKLEAK